MKRNELKSHEEGVQKGLEMTQGATRAFINAPNSLDIIFEHVANGGSLIDICRLNQVSYRSVINWISADPERKAIYEQARKDRDEWARENIFNELRLLGSISINDIYNEDGTLKHPKDMEPHVARTVKSIETEIIFSGKGVDRVPIGETKRIVFWEKTKILEMHARALGLWTDTKDVKIGLKLEDVIAKANENDEQ